MAKSPAVIPFSTDGVEIPLKNGITLPTDARGFISVGLDGTTARFVVVDSSGRQVFVGAGVAGTPAGGVVSVQGVAGGTAIPISAASLPLPTGAATETTLASRLADATFTARINTLGQKTMANSTPVVLSSDQSAIPVTDNGGSLTVDGTITANIGTSGSLALDATLTGGTQKAIVRGGAKGATTAADVTSTAEGADHQALDIQIYHGGVAKDPTAIRALTSSDVVTAAQGTAAAATAPWATRLSDGTAFYDGTKTGQLPSALVGGRLDTNNGAWLGSTAPTVGQKTMAASIPIVIASDQGAVPVSGTVTANIGTTNGLALDATLTGGTQKAIVRGGAKGATTAADVTSQNVDANTQALHVYIAGGGGSGGTASNFGAAFPSQGTAGGFFDGTNMQGARVFDADSGAGSQFVLGAILRKSASGGSVEAGTSTDPLRVDPTGTTTQPISAASLPLPTGAATETTLASRLADATFTARINTLGQKTMANSTPVVLSSDQSAIPVTDNGGSLTVDGTVTANQGGTWTVQQGTPPWSVVGAAADGAAPSGNPVLIAGQDGTNVQSIRTLTDGTVQVRYKELATFTALATATVVGNNKSMLSIVNASGSTVQVRVLSIHVVNVQTTAVTGVTGTFEVRRCVNHSAGTAITAIEKMDSADALSGSVTVRTNGTITTESTNLLWRALFSTDEWGPGTQDVESGDHIFQTMFPIWKRRDMDAKPILLRANEGLTVKFATNSTAGSFDILVVFTQE